MGVMCYTVVLDLFLTFLFLSLSLFLEFYMAQSTNRRDFLKHSGVAVVGAGAVLAGGGAAMGHHHSTGVTALASGVAGAQGGGGSVGANIYLSAKWGMVRIKGSILDKFKAMKEIGYDGMELNSPIGKKQIEEFVNASKKSGMPIHGTVNAKHWNVKYSVAANKKADRDRSVKTIIRCIENTRAVGGDAMLLVCGVQGRDGKQQEVWEKSVDSIRQCLPTAAKNGVRILFENVWNGFCQTPELARDYVDAFSSPWVGHYFDMGNHIKFRAPQDWIRVLGHRIVKLDGKDFDKPKNKFADIGSGSADWPEIRKALAEINYTGWCTAEVAGGGVDRMTQLYKKMDRLIRA